jgi:hypothetical protein
MQTVTPKGIFLGLLLFVTPAVVQGQFGYMTNADNTNTITITNYSGPGGAVTIPTNINGLTVASIGSNAFCTNGSLTSVTIPDTITSIGYEAFFFCTSLTNVTISNSVTNIGYYSFGDCRNLTIMTIPEGVTTLGEGAFYACIKLRSVTIPGSVASMGNYVFASCTSLTNVSSLGNVTSIGDYAFNDCSGLTKITIPDTVTRIGDAAFVGTSLTNITIPGSVTSIGDGSTGGTGPFCGCTSLITVSIASGVINIEEDAFDGCTSLANVTIPASVTSIGSYAFYDCTGMAGVYFAGNAPGLGSDGPFADGSYYDHHPTLYYLPGTTGWSSTFAGLTSVLWNPLIEAGDGSLGVSNNQFGFNITGTNNFTVVVEACTNLGNPVWTPLQTVTLINGSFYFSEPLQTNIACRFYSLALP